MNYDYYCKDCSHEFDYDEGFKSFMGREYIECPHCRGGNIKNQEYGVK